MDALKTCKEAAADLHENFIKTKDDADWPKGCYLSDGVFFNEHLTGSSNHDARQICNPRGKRLN